LKQRQYEALKSGIQEARRLKFTNTKKHTISPVSWIQEINLLVETRGFDTIFREVDGSGSTANETYIIEKWGDLQLRKIETFVSNLTDPYYDLENLQLSGLAIRDQPPKLQDLNYSRSTLTKYYINDAQVGELRLQDIPGKNVAILGEKITQSSKWPPPTDLSAVRQRNCRNVQEQEQCSHSSFPEF
jgi:hypothetical protein